MKNFNFFNNLFSRVKEDSSPTVNRRSTDGQSQRHYTLGLMKYAAIITLLLTLACGQAWGDDYTETYSNPTGTNTPARANGMGAFSIIGSVTGDVSFGNSSLQINTNAGSGTFNVSSTDGSYIESITFTQDASYPVNTLTSEQGTVTGPTSNVFTFTPNSATLTSATFSMSAQSSKKVRLAPIVVNLTSDYEYFSKNFSISSETVSCTKSNGSSDITITSTGGTSNNGLTLANTKALTIASSGHNIKAIHFTCESHNTMSNLSANTGTYSSNGWTKSTATNTVTFTSSGSNATIVGISVELEAGCTSISPSLSYTSTSLMVGDDSSSPTLTGNTGSGTVTWTSSDEDVATVNESTGVVTAVAAGTATITASIAANGGYCNGSATANFTITRDPVGEDHVLTWPLTTVSGSSESNVDGGTTDIGTGTAKSTSSYITNQTDLTGVGVKRTTTGKNSNTGKIETPTLYDAAKYVSFTFDVEDGYQFTPTEVSIKTVAVSTAKDLKFEFSDAKGSYSVTKENLSTSSAAATNTLDFSECNVDFTGTVTVKIYVYGAADAYRLSTPLTITGDVAAVAAGDCSAYEFHYGTHGEDDWETACFERVGETEEWRIENFTIPSTPNFYLGYHGDGSGGWNSTWSAEKAWTDVLSDGNGAMALLPSNGNKVGQATGAVGTLIIWNNSGDKNKYIGFKPNGYVLKFGSIYKPFAVSEGNEYRSDLVEYNSTNARDAVSVGMAEEDGDYVVCARTEPMQHLFLKDECGWNADGAKFAIYDLGAAAFKNGFMTAVPGESGLYEGWVDASCTDVIFVRHSSSADSPSWDNDWNQTPDLALQSGKNLYTLTEFSSGSWSAYERKGKFRMNADWSDQNWYVRFYPYNVLTYDANGGSSTMSEQSVAADAVSKTVSVASNGFTAPTGKHFDHWDTEEGDGGTDYAEGADYTLMANATLYAQWAWNTYDVSTSFTNVSVKTGTTGTGAATHGSAYTVTLQGATGYNLPTTVTVTIGGSPATLTTDYTWNSSTGVLTVLAAKVTGNISITASGVAQVYDITYKDQGDVAFSGDHADGYPTTHTYGSSTTLKTASKTGYTFGGWFTTSACTGDAVASLGATDYTAGITLYAKWTIKTYTVTMAASPAGYGSVSPTSIASVPHGSEVDIDDNVLTLNGTDVTATATTSTAAYTYAFSGWSVSDGDAITSAQTITATFARTANSYDVTLSYDNDEVSKKTGSTGTDAATYGTDYVATFQAKSGFTLQSDVTVTIGESTATRGTEYTWSVSEGVGTLTVGGSYITDDIEVAVDADADVTTYSVTYAKPDGATGTPPADATAYDSGDEVTVKANTDIAKDGTTFRGWTDGTTFYLVGQKFNITSDVTLTAVLDDGASSGTATYTFNSGNSNGLTIATTNASWTYSVTNETYNNIPVLDSYFLGMSFASSSTGELTITTDASYANIDSIKFNSASTDNGNPKIAIYEVKKNGADSTELQSAIVVSSGTVKKWRDTPYTKDIHNLSPQYSGKVRFKLTTGSSGKYGGIDNISIYYKGDKSFFTVSFANQTGFGGSTTLPSNIIGVPSGKKIVPPADPTAVGYTFSGWYSDAACTAGNEVNLSTMTITADKTIYAKWCANHTVAWVVNGSAYSTGSPTTSTTDCDGITVMPTAPADNTLSCATSFRGWSATNLYGEATNTQPADLFVTAANAPTINADKTFYAVYGTATSAALVGTVLWSEDWTDESNNATPSSPTTGGGYAIAGASIGYEYTDGTGDNKATTKVATGTNAGGVSPELMVGYGTTTAGAFTVTGLPKKGAKELTLIFKRNNSTTSALTPSVTGEGYSISKVSGSDAGTYVYTITCGAGSTFDLTFTGSTTRDKSVRIDDIVLKVKTDGATNYRCICPSLEVTEKLVTASTPIFITSAAGKTVRSQDSLVIVGSGLAKNATLSISSPASKFALKSGKNGTLTTDATGAIDTVAYIYYTPGEGDTSDGLDKNNSFTISDGTNTETVSTALIGRHLPANFVIAAKNGDNWYALPAGMGQGDAAGTRAPVQITVDDNDDPTIASTSDANVYSLIDVPAAVHAKDSGDYVILWMHGKDKPLYGNRTTAPIGSSSKSVINNLDKDYWWALTQKNTSITNAADAKYNISVANGNTNNPLKIWLNAGGTGVPYWGLYSSTSNIITEIRLIPWTCANPAAPTISGETEYTEGETITLEASHDGSNHDAMTTYTWYKGADWATASAASPVQAAATGSSGYTLTIASCTTDDAGTYWCEASNGTCSAHNSSGYAITVSEASCTPQSISKVVVTGSSAGTTSGYNEKEYVGTPVINVSGKTSDATNIDGVTGNETGYKMSSDGSSIVFATLAKGTFQEGDVVKIGITRRNDTRQVDSKYNILTIYYGTSKSDAAALTTIETDGDNDNSAAAGEGAGFYTYTLTASDITTIGSKKGIGLFRESSNGENPYVYSVEIIGCRDWTTCTAPTAVSAGTITSNGATFTITDAENTLDYELYISTSSTTPTADATPTATSSSKTKVVTSLDANTTYYYWVRSNCGGYKSEWVAGASTFATLAAATTYSVTYYANGATSGSVPTDDTDYKEGDVVTVKTNSGSLAKSGYTFVGWSTNATPSSGIFYPAGYKFTMGAGNVNLYAVLSSGSSTCATITNFETSQHSNSSNNPDSQGKYIYGYKTTVDAEHALTITTSVTNNKGQNSGADMLVYYGTSIYIYADNTTTGGTPATFSNVTSVSLKVKNKHATKYSTLTIKVGSTTIANAVALSGANNSSYTTYTYDNLANLSGKIEIHNGGSGSTDYNFYIDDIEICTGSGASLGYSVTFDKQDKGGDDIVINNVPSGSKIGAPVPAPTETGYSFGGWYREAGCSNAWNFGSNTITQDTTLFAKWTSCAPTISADPSGTSYNQNADATALSVAATGEDLTYQWYSNESNSNSDGTEIPGATSASYTPSTALVGTIYYYCIVTNDCGNATSAVAAITVNDSKPNPTATWTIATPTHGGKGFSFSVTAYKNDGSTAWDGTLTTAMLSASEDVVLSGVTVNDNTISGTYGLKASATSPVTFYLELPSTTTQAAATLSEDKEFTACSGTGVDGSTYEVPFLAKYSSSTSGKPSYYCESEHGYISPELGTSSVSLASEGYDDFDYYINSGRGSVLIFTKVDEVKKIQVYLNANSGPAKVTNVYTAASYSTALKDYTELTEKTDYTVTYTDEDSNTSIAKGKNGHVDIAFTTNIAEGTLVYVVLKEKAKYFGAKLTTGAGSGATIDTELAWNNSQSDGATVEKGEDDAEFTITATRSNSAAQASLGEIRYSSSDTKIATVNATTGEVTIADKISFGEDEYKTTTIKATLVSSGCYKSASITYTLQVNKSTCTEAAGTVAITSESDCSVELTVSGYEEDATIQWQKDGSDIPCATSTTYTATTSGTYTAVTTKTCARTSNSIVVIMSATATASKIVDSWYVKNGRRTPDIALVQTTGATSFTVKSGETTIWDEANSNITGFGGCDFELKEDGIIYLHGTKDNGDAPSDLVAGNETITVTVSGCGGALSGLDIIVKKQAETPKPSVAFVVDGTKRSDGGTATSVSTAKTSERPLWTYLSSTFSLTGCNMYWSVDSKELREYYSQYDAIVVTDDPSTDTKGAGNVSYVKAFGTLVDVRPILTMEAYVGKFNDGGWHVYNATPTSPNPRQVEMKLECKNHEIFAGVSESSDNVRTETINGDEYWYITIVDTTQSPYKGTTKDYKDLPALQGFDPNSFSDMLGIGTIKEDELQAGVERQDEPAARMMILGIQNNAMGALTNEGKLIIKNAISYLLKTNMEEVDDCSNYFIGGTEGHTNDWTVATNWSKNSVPDFTTKVRIMAPVVITKYQKVRAAQVDIVKGGASKHIDGEPNGGLTINPGGALIVGGTVNRAIAPHYGIDDLQPTTDEDIFIKADENNSAALILDNSSGLTEATVQMYSPSYWEWKDGGTKIQKYWSYVAVPIQEALIPDYFYGAFTYYYEEKDGWKKKWDGDYLYPFQAIGLSRDLPGTEHFWGPLVSTENRDIPLTKTAMGGGENMIANSWTAPIQIANFDISDFGDDVKATIYMYNTGSADYHEGTVTEATGSYDGRGTAGQWLGIPIGVAKLPDYKGLDVIPALQTFEVDFESGVAYGAKDTLHLDYDRLVRGIDITKDTLTEKLHAPKRRMVKNDGDVEAVMKVRVAGIHTFAEVWLIQDGAFSEGYDNGWEANYAACDDRSPQLYAHSEIGNMGVIAKPELEGTILGFAPSRDGADYTFSFYYRGDEELYLNDLLTETSTPITSDDTYAFTASENGDGSRFIISRNPYQQPLNPTSTEAVGADGQNRAKKIIYNDKIYILYNGMIYDAMGRVINRK